MSVEMLRKTSSSASVGSPLACWALLWFGVASVVIIPAGSMSVSTGRNVTEGSHRRAMRFTADELLNTQFPSRISDDIDLDPCKGGKCLEVSENSYWLI